MSSPRQPPRKDLVISGGPSLVSVAYSPLSFLFFLVRKVWASGQVYDPDYPPWLTLSFLLSHTATASFLPNPVTTRFLPDRSGFY